MAAPTACRAVGAHPVHRGRVDPVVAHQTRQDPQRDAPDDGRDVDAVQGLEGVDVPGPGPAPGAAKIGEYRPVATEVCHRAGHAGDGSAQYARDIAGGRHLIRAALAVPVLAWCLAAAAPVALAATTPTTAPPPAARAEILVDADTGRVLFGAHEHDLLPPASLTKMLTAMIAVDWLKTQPLLPVSARTAGVAQDKVGMKAGQRWPFGIALHAMLISSANDAAYAFAERIAGTVERFSTIMRLSAAQLGLSDPPVLHDPAGLDGTEGAEGGNLASAWDMAIAARDLMANPTLASIVALKSFRFTGPDGIVYALSSHNRAFLNSYPGAIGVKTGYTVPAGVCVAEEAVRGGRTMLAVIMNGVSPDQTAAMLLDRGFATPVGSEPAGPVLPAVRQPEPPPPPPPTTLDPPVHAALAAPVTAAAPVHGSAVITRPVGVGAIVAAACALALVSAGVLRRYRRPRRPVGAHSRRGGI